jgi:hypothetical protein
LEEEAVVSSLLVGGEVVCRREVEEHRSSFPTVVAEELYLLADPAEVLEGAPNDHECRS